jgi:hypothetical protein
MVFPFGDDGAAMSDSHENVLSTTSCPDDSVSTVASVWQLLPKRVTTSTMSRKNEVLI